MVTKDSAEILRRLGDADVEIIVVGMAAAILQGVPTTDLAVIPYLESTIDELERQR